MRSGFTFISFQFRKALPLVDSDRNTKSQTDGQEWHFCIYYALSPSETRPPDELLHFKTSRTDFLLSLDKPQKLKNVQMLMFSLWYFLEHAWKKVKTKKQTNSTLLQSWNRIVAEVAAYLFCSRGRVVQIYQHCVLKMGASQLWWIVEGVNKQGILYYINAYQLLGTVKFLG